jgi:isocitrate dehydrogenase (NAD+)
MPSELTVVRIAGDGVGPELVDAGTRVIEALGLPVTWVDMPAGLAAYEQHGTTAPPATIEALRRHRLAIKGPFSTPNGGDIRSANHHIRHQLDLFACVRPLPIGVPGRPVLLVRENLEDLYGAIEWYATPDVAQAVKVATRSGCRRICEYAFTLARRHGRSRVTLVHKANNLKLTEGLFLQTAEEVARDFPDVGFDEMLADTAGATLVWEPESFDVMVTSHTIGDILSNVGAAVAGSLGLVGSLNSGHGIHVAEASHGSASLLAGKDQVNPLAFIEGIVLLLDAIGWTAAHDTLAEALAETRRDGPRTLDLGGQQRTSEVVDHLCAAVKGRRVG